VSNPAPSSRRLLPRLALSLLSLTLSLAAAELFCRATESDDVGDFFTPFEHDDSPYSSRELGRQAADGTGLTLNWYVPGAQGVTGSVPVRINNLGLRDERDYPQTPPADCLRVLVLGDSMTFGKGVREQESWPAILEERLLQNHPKRCIEVLNSGIPNTNFHIQWLHFLERWRSLQPDLVLVGFFVYNDSQLQEDRELYFPGWMATVDSTPALKSSALVRLAYYRAFTRIGRQLLDQQVPRYFEADYPGWQQFQRSLADLQLVGLLDGFRTAVALIPIPTGYDNYPFDGLHEQLRGFVEGKRGIPSIDLLEGLAGVDASAHWVHPSDGHPDPEVHRLMGEQLAKDPRWRDWLGPGQGQQEAPVAGGHRREPGSDGIGWASGQWKDGQRSGPWLAVQPSTAPQESALVEWGPYERGQRSGSWTLRTSTWQDEGWEIREETGSMKLGKRNGAWHASTTFKAHSSLELQLGGGAAHAGPWRSEDQVSDVLVGRDESHYLDGTAAGIWLHWESQEEGEVQLASAECFRPEDGEMLWEWGRADATDEADPSPAPPGSGILVSFEAPRLPGSEDLDSPGSNSDEAGDHDSSAASTPRSVSADAVLQEACPGG